MSTPTPVTEILKSFLLPRYIHGNETVTSQEIADYIDIHTAYPVPSLYEIEEALKSLHFKINTPHDFNPKSGFIVSLTSEVRANFSVSIW